MSAAKVPIGTKLGRYEVVRHLARGGMADLSIARATGMSGFERHVVIKHLRPEESEDATFVEMFLTEARLAGALHHHNIVQVHDIGQEAGRHFFAMEYVHGEDVRHLLSRLAQKAAKPPFEHVVAIVSAVAAALHHAHEQKGPDRAPLGIVHRDVTPANIIVGYDGNVKVVDFGIAKAAVRKIDTAVGMLKGKVPYMAPEQVTGKQVDRRSDVFALGIVLYELVTVRRLFKGDNEFYVMSAVIGGDIPLPSKHRPDLPKALESIIMKALSRNPSERFQTADEMRLALETFAEQSGLRFSSSALASYMKQMFGERQEPWVGGDNTIEISIEFDKLPTGLVEVPTEAIEKRAIPKLAAPTRGSLIEQARLNAISSELPATPQRPKTLPSVVKPDAFTKPRSPSELDTNPSATSNPFEPTQPDVVGVFDAPKPKKPPKPPSRKVEVDAEATTVDKAPPVIEAKTPEREPTAVVPPLPLPVPGTVALDTAPTKKTVDRKWLLISGLGAAAVVAAVIVVFAGGSSAATRKRPEPIDLSKHVDEPAPAPQAAADPPKAEEPKPEEPKAEEPKPEEPKAEEPKPEEPKPEEPKPEEPKAAPEPVKPEPVKADPPKPAVVKKPVVRQVATKPKQKPVQKPKQDPKWDPNALFLKKKP